MSRNTRMSSPPSWPPFTHDVHGIIRGSNSHLWENLYRAKGKLCKFVTCPLNRLHHRFNLTLVCNKVVPRSLVWAPYWLNKLPEVCFEFPFNMIGKSTMAFLTSQSWCELKSWYTDGDPEQGFWPCFADGLNQSVVSFLVQATPQIIANKNLQGSTAGLCFSRAWWPLVPNFCSWATRKSQIFDLNHMMGTLDFTVSEHWASFNFS